MNEMNTMQAQAFRWVETDRKPPAPGRQVLGFFAAANRLEVVTVGVSGPTPGGAPDPLVYLDRNGARVSEPQPDYWCVLQPPEGF